MSLSVCIICFNEEHNLARCLESASWADEIVVVDSLSSDGTVSVARRYTERVYERPWPGYMAQKNYALSKARCEWVLSVDADEEISGALRDEILIEVGKPDAFEGYRMPRRSFYQGRWINHSGFYPDTQLRLFKRGSARWVGSRVHERAEVRGRVGEVRSDLLHYPYGGSIAGQLATVNNFSGLLAEDLHDRGARFHVGLLLFRPVFKFLEVYLLKLGFLDGLAGFVIAVTSAYAMFVRYVKLRELSTRRDS